MYPSEAVERAINRIPSTINVVTTGHTISPTKFDSVNDKSGIKTNSKRRTRVSCSSDASPPYIGPTKSEVKLPNECRGHLIVDFDEVDSPCSNLVEAQRNFDLLRRYPARKRQKKAHNNVEASVMALAISTASIVDAEIHHLLNGIAELENLLVGDSSQECPPNTIEGPLPSNLGFCVKQKCVISQDSSSGVGMGSGTSPVHLQRSISSSTTSSSLSS